jgi:ATP-dependent helicase/nuclease subunit A
MDDDAPCIRDHRTRSRDAMIELADRTPRERFASKLDRNFSVIASAGSGKTTAITQRVVQIAKSANARQWLPKLIVVTYTNRAADELQQRAREQILELVSSLDVAAAFNQAFFGTIHSFCLKLLAAYGHYLGLPPELETITDDNDLWNEFLQRQTTIGRSLSKENRAELLRLVSARQLMELARCGGFDSEAIPPQNGCPDTDFSEVYSVVARGNAVRTIPRLQEELRRWEQRRRETREFVPLPICTSQAKEFSEAWHEAFRPLRDWINACATCVAAEVQRNYREFRLERGMINYYDQVGLAIELMRHPEAGRRIREKDYRVILDEAQDTEPGQFSVLLEVARPPSASGLWMEHENDPPRAGHFCMVGDFQQSIYRDRTDLERYRQLHERLRDNGVAEELTFSVTFRLDQAQLNFVNQAFRDILNSVDGQVAFVELNPRPDVLPGQMIRLDLAADVEPTAREELCAASEARQLAEWLCSTALEKLRADSWRQVAILSPRKAWLPILQDALRAVGLRAQIQSETDRKGESPHYAWLTALLTIMANPRAAYEIVGVLREVFGISDDALARFSQGNGARFQIDEGTPGRGVVPDALNLLTRIHNAIAGQSLFTAVREIVRATQLRERLLSLPADDFDDQVIELDALLAAAATAEANGATLADFAEDLLANFDETREVRPSSEDAIQLMTAHKAKGLEWQVVIVPFLSRQVRTRSSRYPRAIKALRENVPQIVFHKTDISPDLDSELKVSERQEMERLLYVALTRAKHSLVLALDRELFANANGEIHKDSQIKWLRCDTGGCNERTFAAVSIEAAVCSATAAHQKKSRAMIESAKLTEPAALPPVSFENGRKRAENFVHTLNPSEFSAGEERLVATRVDNYGETHGAIKPPVLVTPATRYGLWWHDFIQQIPWNADVSSWERIFQANRPLSPDMARSTREWKLLCEYFSSSADLRRRFTDRQFLAHSEMPFYWRMDANTCLQGVVDLALFDLATPKWLILDWKTDRVAPEKIDILHAQYRSQIAAYWKAISEMTGMKVEAAIYSTPAAKLVTYDQDELTHEWARLKTLRPNQFAEAVSRHYAERPVQMEFVALSDRARRG